MANDVRRLRTIVEQEMVSARVDQSRKEHPRFEEYFDGLKWWLARKSLVGDRAPGIEPPAYVIKTIPWFAMRIPATRTLYRVSEHDVVIESFGFIEK